MSPLTFDDKIKDLSEAFGFDVKHFLAQFRKLDFANIVRLLETEMEQDRLTLSFERVICDLWVLFCKLNELSEAEKLELMILERVRKKWGEDASVIFLREKRHAYAIQKDNFYLNLITGKVTDISPNV